MASIKFKEIGISYILVITIIIGIISSIINITIDEGYIYTELINILSKLIIILLITNKAGFSIRKIKLLHKDFVKKFDYREIFNLVAIQLVISFGTSLIVIFIVGLVDIAAVNNIMNENFQVGKSIFIISMIISIIITPIFQELIFRGIIFIQISKRYNIITGVIVSSIIFGIFNMKLAIIGAIILGMANCILYCKYKNIFIPIIVNCLYNLLYNLSYIIFNIKVFRLNILSVGNLFGYGAVGVILFLAGLLGGLKFIKNNRKYISVN